MKKELTRRQYMDLYYYMRLNRAVEDTMWKLVRQNKIVGGLYSSLGQEAISVGTAYALEKKDWLAPMIRNIGALLVKGVRPRDIFMQHMAKYDSPTKGKDGTSHFGDLDDLHIVSPISMLGDLIPVMTGVAMAGRYLGQKIVPSHWTGAWGTPSTIRRNTFRRKCAPIGKRAIRSRSMKSFCRAKSSSTPKAKKRSRTRLTACSPWNGSSRKIRRCLRRN